MPNFIDQLGREVLMPDTIPKRIVSLVPSQTELLFYLGLQERVIGVTKFCLYPISAKKEKAKIGGTKNFNLALIDSLKPDLIIGNKEENYEDGINYLSARYPVWISDIYTWQDALNMMKGIGEITHTSTETEKLILVLQKKQEDFKSCLSVPNPSKSVLYLIWREPYMAAGKYTFIDNMLGLAGFDNICGQLERYPLLSNTDLQNLSPNYIFLSSEPYPFKQKHIKELQELAPDAQICLVNGEVFSWYGNRLLTAFDYLSTLRAKLNI